MNQYSNKSKKFQKNLDNEVRQKLCEAAIIRVRALRESLDEAEEKLLKIDQKKETIRENLDGEAKQKVCKAGQKRLKQFVKILMKPKRNYVDVIRKEKQFVKTRKIEIRLLMRLKIVI